MAESHNTETIFKIAKTINVVEDFVIFYDVINGF